MERKSSGQASSDFTSVDEKLAQKVGSTPSKSALEARKQESSEGKNSAGKCKLDKEVKLSQIYRMMKIRLKNLSHSS